MPGGPGFLSLLRWERAAIRHKLPGWWQSLGLQMIEPVSSLAGMTLSQKSARADDADAFVTALQDTAVNSDAQSSGTQGASAAANSNSVVPPLPMQFATAQDVADFSKSFAQKLHAAGIDSGTSVQLQFNAQGHVEAAGNSPDKAKIDAIFAEDPELEDQYRNIACTEANNAEARQVAAYQQAYSVASDDEDRSEVWFKYQSVFKGIRAQEGNMTFSAGRLMSSYSPPSICIA